jgi:hypothetical protein
MHSTYIIFFFVILIPRLLFILFYPENGGDYEIYTTVAKNIINGCGVSLSNPLTNECIPHFGGNHGPGYPIFLSIVWTIFNNSDNAVRIIQGLIYSLACIWLLRSTFLLTCNKKIVTTFAILLAFSPLLIAWPRYVQTETLAIASTIFLLSELVLSISQKKIRIISIGFALILATWIRLDNIFLTIPVAVTVVHIHGLKTGIIKGIIIALILTSSWTAWTARNIIVDLPSLIPSDMTMPDGSRAPSGYLKWTKTWITHEYERPGALWGINRKNYDKINIPERAYQNNEEKIKIQKLLKELETQNQNDFPESIDNQFEEIASQKIEKYPLTHWVIYPSIRAIRIWTNPFSSFGWPNEMPDKGLSQNERIAAASGDTNIIFKKALEYPIRALSKIFNALYRLVLMILLILSIINLFKIKKENYIFLIGLTSISYILARTIFFSFNSNFETRYMVTTIPFIELFVILSIFTLFFKRK